jgi:hypothetical protein
MDMLQRIESGRFKVFKHLNDWFEEFRLYHRKDGKVVKEGDDLMAATRYAIMMLRHASTPSKLETQTRLPPPRIFLMTERELVVWHSMKNEWQLQLVRNQDCRECTPAVRGYSFLPYVFSNFFLRASAFSASTH